MRRLSLVMSATALALAIGSTGAQAATVTVGSPLQKDFLGTLGSAPSGTWVNSALGEAGANVTSPVSGTILSWRLKGAYSGTFKLRVLRPASMGTYTGSGTSSPVTTSGTATRTFQTNLPIQAGDIIGVDIPSGTNISVDSATGSHLINWNPALADGSTSAPPYTNFNDLELGFNADVEYTPPSTPAPVKKKCKKKKKHRSAASAKKKKCKKKKKK